MKNILIAPSWYPSKTDPISGSFLKEQAELLLDAYSIVILHNKHSSLGIFRFLLNKLKREASIRIELDTTLGPIPEVFACYQSLRLNRYLRKLASLFNFKLDAWERRQKEHFHTKIQTYLETTLNFTIDLVFSMTAQVSGPEIFQFSRTIGKPLILAEHVPFPMVGTVVTAELRTAMENCGAVLSVSYDKARQILMQNIKCHPIVVGNLVDETIFTIQRKANKASFNFLIVAAFNFYKDYPTLFQAIAELKETASSAFTIALVGYAPNQRANEWALGEKRFNDLLKNYNIDDVVKLVPRVGRKEIITYYHHADAFILTSIQEGLPVSALEAACCGLPIFATRCGGVEDFVDDDIGRIFNLRDHLSIARSLDAFMRGEIKFDSEVIRSKVISKYGAEAFLRRMTYIFNQVMDKGALKQLPEEMRI